MNFNSLEGPGEMWERSKIKKKNFKKLFYHPFVFGQYFPYIFYPEQQY